MEIFLVSWTGGYEAPAYDAFRTEENAWEQAYKWAEEMREGEDSIDVLAVDLDTMVVRRLELQEDAS